MLEVFQIKKDPVQLSKERFDMTELSHSVLEKLKSQTMLQLTPPPKITASGPVFGSWDKARIEKMLIHVLTNAFKYGKGKPISVHVIEKGDLVRIEVSDQGNGISTRFKEKIFEKFERGISSNEVSGFGLGLYYSKKIVEAHSGKIWFESKVDHGTKFIVELPLNAAEIEDLSEFEADVESEIEAEISVH